MRGEREEATAASVLIVGTINRQTGVVAVQESPNATMADKEHFARRAARQSLA